MSSIRLFTGWDEREAVGWHTFVQSVLDTATAPIQIQPITPTVAARYAVAAEGTNAFTRARFLVPHLCGYEGWAIFVDGADMLCRGDLAELWAYRDFKPASGQVKKDIWCVKHAYHSRFLQKYEGTEMEAENRHYDRKNWASLFLIDCASPFARLWHPDLIARRPLLELLQLSGFHDDRIGALPVEWNWLVGEQVYNAQAKIAHFTLGIPGFSRYRGSDYAEEWFAALHRSKRGLQGAEKHDGQAAEALGARAH